ncbi:MAG: Na/Pi cotransporter family protein, partial [Mesorhizobium sp.]|nr:Na/Pi cotransporter family protein [Mesorhizobium sp.]
MSRLTQALLPDAASDKDDGGFARPASALDRAVIGSPRLALASATRELLRMGELVEITVRPAMELLATGAR